MELNKIFKDGLWSKRNQRKRFLLSHNITRIMEMLFLEGPTERTKAVWNRCLEALAEERENNGVRSLDNVTVSTITSHKAGYIDKKRTDRRSANRRTSETCHQTFRRYQRGGKACHENGVGSGRPCKRYFHSLPQDTQRRSIRRIYRKKSVRSVLWDSSPDFPTTMHADVSSVTTAVWLLWYRPSDWGKKEDLAQPHRSDDRRPHPPARRSGRTNQGLKRTWRWWANTTVSTWAVLPTPHKKLYNGYIWFILLP